MDKNEILNFLEMMMETESFEDFLERFDVQVSDVFILLIEEGLVDLEDLKDIMRTY